MLLIKNANRLQKVLGILLFSASLLSCGGDENSGTEQDSNDLKETTADTSNKHVVVPDFDSLGRYYNTDWEKENLVGKVLSVSLHAVQIDEDGNEFGMGGSTENMEFNFDGRLVSGESYGCCGAMNEEIEYKYNDQNQLTHRIFVWTEPGEEEEPREEEYDLKEKYFYDDAGILVKMKIAGFDQELDEEHEYKFDENNNLVEEVIEFFGQERQETISYKFEKFKLTKSTLESNEEVPTERISTLDIRGNVIEEMLKLKDGNTQETRFTYEYDSKGNWIVRESEYRYVSEDGEEEEWRNSLRETRTIVYF